jgi:nucleotide-binding universal stress UspA family protein
MMIRRVLVATDGSAQGEAAVTLAIDWAGRSGAEPLGLVIPDEPPDLAIDSARQPGRAGGHHDAAALTRANRRVLEFQFERRCAAAGLRGAVAHEVAGTPPEQILAEAPRCDVVILGRGCASRSRRRAARMPC